MSIAFGQAKLASKDADTLEKPILEVSTCPEHCVVCKSPNSRFCVCQHERKVNGENGLPLVAFRSEANDDIRPPSIRPFRYCRDLVNHPSQGPSQPVKSINAKLSLKLMSCAQMLSSRLLRAAPLRAAAMLTRRTGFVQRRCITQADIEDPNMVCSQCTVYLRLSDFEPSMGH
jgi:hypothetical protein